MSELIYQEMPKEKIIQALKELKSYWHGKGPSRYYFALGHAIRFIEANAVLTKKCSGQETPVIATCSKCGLEHRSHMSAANCCR